MTIQIRKHEKKYSSQNGEDGILEYLFQKLKSPNGNFIEIGCSDGQENNSRHLINLGLSGIGADSDWKKLIKYQASLANTGLANRMNLKSIRISLANAHEVLKWRGLEPDIFSLDIDSYDYFIADRLLRHGFRPSIACLETNTFLGSNPVTVDYAHDFSRYAFQPKYGLYFGASPAAWRLLWTRYGYRSLGVDSSGTNIFFILPDRLKECEEIVEEEGDVYQKFFMAKYGKSGEELSETLSSNSDLRFINVGDRSYEERYGELTRDLSVTTPERGMFVTTFTNKAYRDIAYKQIESFDNCWPRFYEFLALSEGCDVRLPSSRVSTAELVSVAEGLDDFKARHRFNPGANGRFGAKYNYVFDCVKWSHKVFAVEAAANISDAELVIYIDSDIVTFAEVPENFLETLIPADVDIAYLPRSNMYSECSFVIYRQRNPFVRSFVFEHADAYRKDGIFQLSGWTDCHVFDFLVRKYSSLGLLKFSNINEGVPMSSHPFINGPLGCYMDHMKGARKVSGKSFETDLVVKRTEDYWKSMNKSSL